jgi:hypothetical protein
MRLDDQIEALATRQHSLVATWQLQNLGATGTEISRLRNSRHWRSVTRRVLAVAGASTSPDQELMAAVLDASPGAVLSHSSAAFLWGAPGWRPRPANVTRHRGISRRGTLGVTVHEVIDLLPHHVRLIRGIPVTSPARTVFDVAGLEHTARTERLLDWCWSERLLDGRVLERTIDDLAQRGRAGSAVMRELVAIRGGGGYAPPASGLERRFEQVLVERGLPAMRRQVDSGGSEWAGRVDFRDAHLPLVVEVHSERYHTALVDQVDDGRRLERLTRAGLEVVIVWDTEVWHEAATVAARVRDGRARASVRGMRSSA